MRVAVPKEIRPGEMRVALVPDIINKLTKAGLDVIIESGAGVNAQASDDQYRAAGARVQPGNVFSDADVVASVQPLSPDQMKSLKKGAITISFLSPTTAVDSIDAAATAGVTAISLELVPRISRAQSMDALTSQALCAGYKATLVAAEMSPRFFPLLMTAAGTVTPANVVVLGAGVAGLQAIATAKRLGAVVSAYDVRPASADEVKSMGAKFITLELEALEGFVLLIGSSFILGAVSALVLAHNIWYFLISMTLFGFGGAFIGTGHANVVGDLFGGKGGQVIAIWQMAGDAGMIVGPIVIGWIADAHTYRAAFLVSGIAFAFTFLLEARLTETRSAAAR